jgi:DNA-binding Lrp family transcriptional regulator
VLTAFVHISAEPARIAELGAELAEIPGVSEVYSVTGGMEDLVAIVRVRHHDELAEVVTGHIARAPGIRTTRTDVAFKVYSRHDLESIFDVGNE